MKDNYRLSYFLLIIFIIVSSKASALDYYWVGGSGNWSDYNNHWATTSGGTTFRIQVPQSVDNVFFDANSFSSAGQSVYLDQTIENCNNMDWTSAKFNPTLTGSSTVALKVYGSLTFITNMSNNFFGAVYFQATTTGQTITSAGKIFNASIYFEGIDGEWTLSDSLNVLDPLYNSATIYLDNGTLNTNNQRVRAVSLGSTGTTNRALNLGSSTLYINGWNLSGNTFAFNAGTSLVYCKSISGESFTFHDVHFLPNTTILASDSFNNAYMEGGIATYIQASVAFNNLTLAPGQNYFIGVNDVVSITTSLSASGSCGGLTYIQNYGTGSATIKKSSGVVNVDYVALQNIKASGGATFTATNCIDLGSNTGWSINLITGRDLFWVNGNGNWSDGGHWSTTSGGTGSGCIPTPFDNVLFDANSFTAAGQSVNIDVIYAYCNDMNWTGATNSPSLQQVGTTNNLEIYGSLTFTQGMTNNFKGSVLFQATSTGKTITSATIPFAANVSFEGIGGGWTVQDSMTVMGNFLVDFGTVNTNSNSIYAQIGFYFAGNGNSSCAFNMGASHIYIGSGGKSHISTWDVISSGVALNTGTSVITFNDNANYTGGNNTYHDLYFNYGASYYFNSTATYNNVYINGDANIQGTNTFNNLTLYAGHAYGIGSNATQTIVTSLNASGSCSGAVTIQSIFPGQQGTIKKVSGAITVDFVFLKDIIATGGATFTANNSIDGGDNTGWTINAAAPKNLFWVGGTGNWSDGTHWSLTSGGSGSGCIPTPGDNVFFDANSFTGTGQTVTVDIVSAYCNDMNWTGAAYTPTIAGITSNVLYVYGSLVLTQGMNISFAGLLYFSATTTGKTITSHGRNIPGQVYFSGVGGEWTLQDSLVTSNFIYFIYGTFNSNNKNIYAGKITGTPFYGPFTLNLGSSLVTVSGFSNPWSLYPGNMTFNAGTSHIKFTDNSSSVSDIVPGGFTYYDVEFTGTNNHIWLEDNNSTFHNLTFYQSVDLRGSNTCNSLLFYNPGCTVTATAGTTQTISGAGQLYALGSAAFPIRIQSSIGGTLFTFTKSAGSVCLDYVRISDSKAIGGASFNAGGNSQDLGGNTGWDFTGGGGGTAGVTVSSSQTGTICSGSNVTFTASPVNGGVAPFYDWFVNGISVQNGASAIFNDDSLANNNFIYCQMTSSASCITQSVATSDSLTITVVPGVQAGTIASQNDTICAGTVVHLSVNGNSGFAQWQSSDNGTGGFTNITGATGQIYSSILSEPTYYRIIANNNTCSDTSTVFNEIVTPTPIAVFTDSISGQEVSFNSDSSKGGDFFNWNFGDSTSSTDQNPAHTYTTSGTFHVCLTVRNNTNCNFTYCNNVEVIPTGIYNITGNGGLTIYPNPFDNDLFIESSKVQFIQLVTIYDLTGREIYNMEYNKRGNIMEANLSTLAPGIYYLKIRTTQTDFVQKIIKE